MATKGDGDFDENEAYDRFPAGADLGYGPDQGFNVKRRVNDRSLFTEEALADPVIAEFVNLPFDVSYLQTKSSSREAEWLIHKPHLVLSGKVPGIDVRDGDSSTRATSARSSSTMSGPWRAEAVGDRHAGWPRHRRGLLHKQEEGS